jgi:hypothetical protein
MTAPASATLAPAVAEAAARVESAIAKARHKLAAGEPVDLEPLRALVKQVGDTVAAGPVGDAETARRVLAKLVAALDQLARDLTASHDALLTAHRSKDKKR